VATCWSAPCAGRLLLPFKHPAPTAIYTLSLHDALPISRIVTSQLPIVTIGSIASTIPGLSCGPRPGSPKFGTWGSSCRARHEERSEEHTSELQSRGHLVCRLLLGEKQRQAGRAVEVVRE